MNRQVYQGHPPVKKVYQGHPSVKKAKEHRHMLYFCFLWPLPWTQESLQCSFVGTYNFKWTDYLLLMTTTLRNISINKRDQYENVTFY